MTDGSEPRYTTAIRAEIERRWQDVDVPVHWMAPPTAGTIIRDLGADPDSRLVVGWRAWLATHLYAQEDIQILLEGLATAEREVRAAHDLYQEPLRLAAEANVKLRQERDEALSREADLECDVAGLVRQLEAERAERDMFRQRWAEEQEARKAAAAERQQDRVATQKAAAFLIGRSRALLRRLLESGLIPDGELLRAVREEVG